MRKLDSIGESISSSSEESENQRQRNLELSFNLQDDQISVGIMGDAPALPISSVDVTVPAKCPESVNYDWNQELSELSLVIDKLIDQKVIASRYQISCKPCRLSFLQHEYKVGGAYQCSISNERERKRYCVVTRAALAMPSQSTDS
jgi:hypothetical protein